MSFYSYLFRRIDYPLLRQLFVRFSGDFSPSKLTSGAFFSLRCLIYKVHAAPSGKIYFTTKAVACQHFSSASHAFLCCSHWLRAGQLVKNTRGIDKSQPSFHWFVNFFLCMSIYFQLSCFVQVIG